MLNYVCTCERICFRRLGAGFLESRDHSLNSGEEDKGLPLDLQLAKSSISGLAKANNQFRRACE